MKFIRLISLFLCLIISKQAIADIQLHQAFASKVSGIKSSDRSLIPQTVTKTNVNKVLGHFLYALQSENTGYLNWIDIKGPIPIDKLALFLNQIYTFSDEARKSIVDAFAQLTFKRISGMKAITSLISEDVDRDFAVAFPQDVKKRISGLQTVDFTMVLTPITKESAPKYLNMLLLSLTKSIDAYVMLLDMRPDLKMSELEALLTEISKLSPESQALLKTGLIAMCPKMKYSVKTLYDLI